MKKFNNRGMVVVFAMQNRRQILKGSASLTMAGIAGTVSGQNESKKTTAREAGIYEYVRELLRENKRGEAFQLLDSHSVRYYTGHDPVSEGDGVSTQGAVWSKGDSDFTPSLIHVENDVWLVTSHIEMKNASYSTATAYFVDDAIGATWDHNKWASPDMTEDNVWMGVHGEHSNHLEIEYDTYNYYGVGALIKYDGWDGNIQHDDFIVNLQTELVRETNDSRFGVKTHYEHTYTAGFPGGVNLSISGSGWSLGLPTLADSWELEKTVYPES